MRARISLRAAVSGRPGLALMPWDSRRPRRAWGPVLPCPWGSRRPLRPLGPGRARLAPEALWPFRPLRARLAFGKPEQL